MLCVTFVSGCFGPKDDSRLPAPNLNPAVEGNNYSTPAGSGSRHSADSPGEQSASHESSRNPKDFEGLAIDNHPENAGEDANESDSNTPTLQAADETADGVVTSGEVPAEAPE